MDVNGRKTRDERIENSLDFLPSPTTLIYQYQSYLEVLV